MAPTARALARQTVTAEILAAARTRLTGEGPAALSLRAVARDVGMVSSAVYRYFPSRDDLLTALLITDYDELGAAVEAAGAAAGPAPGARWVAMCRAIRDWSIAHPGDFALLFGSPVPGYAAPRETVVPATRTTLALVRVVADAVGSGAPGASGSSVTSTPGAAGRPGSPTAPPAAPGVAGPAVADGVATLRSFGITLPDEVLVRTLMAWTTVFGTISFELFGHFVGSVSDPAAYFDQVIVRLADDLGFTATF
ncbi:TetR/AcrR family transcriptional regulator [Curtobacterium flaccumfaciens]|jgi:AcrR family transcriptional regulator|uniref:TetR/AcrR family transcriptional regulator n=1 Tax=Curtobacterium flaccumfaciens TaxID=2035 RepID=UPI001BDE5D5B|nr:TetR/AcrR family transcriptional regulator [Curtobacterium flaccumfaciens]MBT1606515.1 WHG domain-containing protein [Curtobacterium flaccumfaciens pv. betae]MBT1655988.1 WHG domain-containing protein [Curtobacterium flaccumfaciens pv. betae]MCS0472805.1 WHG domain-containing protein [Curtobacterium flaccumfaciens pv. betae]MCS0475806.1 WHG domain-containing protein [Curtobacterium flaccumfaciens pv. betae]MCS0479629.1 WHG domain-containing protein [Curtobacterium flaccumfaciens pv. betae]